MSEYFNQPYFNPDLLDTAIVKKIVGLIKQERSQKLEFYRSFKTIIPTLRILNFPVMKF